MGFLKSFVAVPLSLAAIVAGAATTTDSASSSQAEARAGVLDEVVVTAQRRNESLEKTPLTVDVLSNEALSKQAILSESDLQSAVPGLFLRATQNANQLDYTIRGNSVDPFTSTQPAVLAYVNEVQVTSVDASAFFDLQSIQVLKGPQGTLFGKNVTGGAVLYTTNKPTNDFGGYITARVGDYNRHDVEGALNIPLISDKLLLRVAGFYERRDGFQEDVTTGATIGNVDRAAGRVTLVAKPFDRLSNTLVYNYGFSGGSSISPVIYNVYPLSRTGAIPSNVYYTPTGLNSVFGAGAWAAYLAANPGAYPGGIYAYEQLQNARGPYRVDLNVFPAHNSHSQARSNATTFDIDSNTHIKNTFGISRGSTRDVTDFDGSPYLIQGSQYPSGFVNTLHQYSDELQLAGEALGQRLNYIAGAYYAKSYDYNLYNQAIFGLAPFIPETEYQLIDQTFDRDVAVFAQATYDFSDLVKGLSFTAGGRWTWEETGLDQLPGSAYRVPGGQNSISGSVAKPSWQFGPQLQVTDDLMLYVTTRHSFRSGGFNYASPIKPGLASVGGTEFLPEVATDVEFGFKYSGVVASLPTRLNVAAYSQWTTDIQRGADVNIPGIGLASLVVNVPKSKVQGIDADGLIKPARWLTIGGTLSYIDAKFTENEVLLFGTLEQFGPYPNTAKWSGSVYAEATFAMPENIGSLSFRSDGFSQSRSYFGSLNNTVNPGSDIPGYTLVNFRVGMDNIRNTGLSLAAYVRNAFDRVYYIGGIPVGDVETYNSAIPGDRRTFYVEGNYKF